MQNHVYTRVGLYTALAILTAACSTVYFTEDDFRRAAQVHDAELVRLGPAFAGTARALEDLCGDAAQDVRYPERRAGGKNRLSLGKFALGRRAGRVRERCCWPRSL